MNATLEIDQGDPSSTDEATFVAWYTNPDQAGGESLRRYAPIGAYAVYGMSGVFSNGVAQGEAVMWLEDRLVGVTVTVPSTQLSDAGATARKLLGTFLDAYAPA